MASLKSYLAKLEACLGGLAPNAQQAVMEELRGHLEDRAAALRAAGLGKEASMSEAIERFGEAGEVGTALRDVHGRGSWGKALAGMVPFLAFGLTKVLYEVLLLHPNPVWLWGEIACYVVLLIGLGVGWVKGFPRWSYPYGGLVLVSTLGWMGIPAQNLSDHNIWILKRYNELLGWRAWIPFLLMAVIALLLTRSVRPLRQLITGVWHDWTRFSFGLYGVMPMAVWIGFDEVSFNPVPYLFVSMVGLAGGALAYVRSARTSQRALALLIGMTLTSWMAMVGPAIFYPDVVWKPWVTMRGVWYAYGRGDVAAWGVLTAVMFAPALLGLLRRSVKFIRAG
jgi:hypothetical protein